MGATVRELYSVFKLRIGFAIAFSAIAGLAVTPGPALPAWKIVVLSLAVLMSAASAGAFNQFIERDLDARMNRTKNRPFVTGKYQADGWWLFTIVGLLVVSVGAAAMALNVVAAFYVFAGAFVYGVVYTVWLKRRTWMNIVIGGLSGSFAVLAGAAAVDPGLSPVPVVLALVLFLWTPPHFWALAAMLREDYAKAGVPMLPVVVGNPAAAWVILAHTVALVAVSIVPFFLGLGWLYLVAALLGGGVFILRSLQFVIEPTRDVARVAFRASLIQLCLLLIGAVGDRWLFA